MSHRERLLSMLLDDPKRRHINIKFFRGSSESISEDAFCEQVTTALFQRDNELLQPSDVMLEEAAELRQIDVRHLSVTA